MVFIDYVTLMLINMAAGLLILGWFLVSGWGGTEQRQWAPGFGIVGAVALLTGLHTIYTWPLPGAFNCIFGELSVMFGALFLGAAWAVARGLTLRSVSVYAFFAGLAALILGIRINVLGLTQQPLMSCIGFCLTGIGGMLVLPVVLIQRNRALRIIAAVCLVLAGLLWLLTGYMGYWSHAETFGPWRPETLQQVEQQK